jgi:hypothetical protein
MTPTTADRVCELTTSTGTGPLALAGAVAGYRSFLSAIGNGVSCYYCVEAVDAAGLASGGWEVGVGTLSGGSTLSRTTVLASSNAGALVSFAAGTKRVLAALPKELLDRFALLDTANVFTAGQTAPSFGTPGGHGFDDSGASFNSVNVAAGSIVLSDTGDLVASHFWGDGSHLTGLPAPSADAITTGTLTDGRLSSNVPLKNAANTFTAGPQVFVGGLTGRQTGGTAGVQEFQVTHDGTRTIVTSLTGPIRFVTPGLAAGRYIELSDTSGTPCLQQVVSAQCQLRLAAPGSNQGWDVDNTNVDLKCSFSGGGIRFTDARVGRAASKVVDLTDASSTTGATLRSLPLSPAQITATQNDYNPGVARNYRLTSDIARTVTGLSVSQVDGQECWLCNAGSSNITLSHQGAGSSAANRFLFSAGADVVLAPGKTLGLWYDGTTQRWRDR